MFQTEPLDPRVAAIASQFPESPFTRADLHRLGISQGELRQLRKRDRVVSIVHGVYCLPSPSDRESDRRRYLRRAAAELIKRPRAVLSHESAAAAHGLPNPHASHWDSLPITLTASEGSARRRRGVHTRRRPLHESDVVATTWGRVTTPERTAVDLAMVLALPEALVVVDAVARRMAANDRREHLLRSAVRRELRVRLLDSSRALVGRRGSARAVVALGHADPAAESPAESRSRGWIILAQLPLPRVGLPVIGDDGRRYFADFAWEDRTVIGEVDGLSKYDTGAVLIREKTREDALRRAGWTVVRWTGSEITRNPPVVLERLRRALLP